MPLITNSQALIQRAMEDDTSRLLLLYDETHRLSAYALIACGYDTPYDEAAVKQLFDETLKRLLHATEPRHALSDIPLMNSVGPHKITVLSKSFGDRILMRSGAPVSAHAHVGLG